MRAAKIVPADYLLSERASSKRELLSDLKENLAAVSFFNGGDVGAPKDGG
jgi:hypothetical protein